MDTQESESKFLADGRQWLWSANSLETAETCARKYYYSQVLELVPQEENVHLLFGGWLAEAIETYHRLISTEIDHNTAVRDVISSTLIKSYGKLNTNDLRDLKGSARYKTREHLIRSIVWYLDEYENDPCKTIILANGTPAVELTFRFQIHDDIWLRGKVDRLVNYASDPYIQDQKSTGTTIGPYYFKQFNPHTQMSLYTVAADIVWKTPVKGVMIDAIQVAVGFTRFERGFTPRTSDQSAEWLQYAEYHIKLTWDAAEHNWPMNDSSCNKYGGCPFLEVCSKSPSVRQDYLDGGKFVRRFRNPLDAR